MRTPALKNFIDKHPSLRLREFRCYLTVRFGLIFALNMQSTIVYYWIYDITRSKLALGFVGLAEVIPALGFSLIAGHIVDLKEKRGMVLRCLSGYILLAIMLATLTFSEVQSRLTTQNTLHLVYVFIFFGGVLRAFYSPSMFSLFGLVMPREWYANATSWSSMAWQMGAVLGPLLAGFTIAWAGITNGMLLVLAIQLLLLWPLLSVPVKPILKKVKEPIFESLTQGIRFVVKTPALLGAQMLDMFSVLFGGAVALLPVFQKEILNVDQTGFGMLRAAQGMGALITLFLLAFLPLRTQPGRKLFLAVGGFALSIIGFGLSTHFWLSFVLLIFSGMFDAVSVVIRSTILQLVTPDEMRGRVSSVNTMFVSSSNELGDFESGVMAHYLGAARAVVVGGCITLAVVVMTYLKSPQLRNFSFSEARREREE